MKKIKVFFDIIREEQWLNEQLRQGYRCTHVNGFGRYTFEETDVPHVLRLDYQNYMPGDKFQEYKSIYVDFGWTHIRGSRLGSIQYWQKPADGQQEIFSDRQSLTSYYKRVMNYSLSLALVFFIIGFTNIDNFQLYMAQGLWEMEGSLFWKAFLFETPFALLRGSPYLLLVFFGISYYRAYRRHERLAKQS